MASKAVRGRDATIYVGGIDASPYLNEYEIESERDDIDVTPFGTDDKEFLSGSSENTTTLTGFWNGDEDSLDEILDEVFGSDDADQILVCGGGVLSGKAAYILGDATQMKYKVSAEADDLTEAEAEFRSKRHRAVILKNPAFVTSTGTGDPHESPAATNFGYVASLHVLDITGAPTSVAIALEQSADDTTYAALGSNIATLTVADVGKAFRFESAKTINVEKFVQAKHTITGGTTPTVSYVLAFHRRKRA
jgi:hypothetical protein